MYMSNSVYLCGPMTGYPGFNFPAFAEAAVTLRGLGITVVSPAEVDEEHGIATEARASTDGKFGPDGKLAGQTWGDMLARDVKIVADQVSGVAVLPGWMYSKGAKLEVIVAILADKAIYEYHTGQGITPLSREWVKHVLTANL
jgi:Domain of unknown function (DUF4406)